MPPALADEVESARCLTRCLCKSNHLLRDLPGRKSICLSSVALRTTEFGLLEGITAFQ